MMPSTRPSRMLSSPTGSPGPPRSRSSGAGRASTSRSGAGSGSSDDGTVPGSGGTAAWELGSVMATVDADRGSEGAATFPRDRFELVKPRRSGPPEPRHQPAAPHRLQRRPGAVRLRLLEAEESRRELAEAFRRDRF